MSQNYITGWGPNLILICTHSEDAVLSGHVQLAGGESMSGADTSQPQGLMSDGVGESCRQKLCAGETREAWRRLRGGGKHATA